MSYKVLSTCKVFGGTLTRATHASAVTKCEMTFAVFMPEVAEGAKVPALYYLSGLTCTDENVMGKSGAQRAAAQHGIALIAPDTSPRAPAPLPAPGLRSAAPVTQEPDGAQADTRATTSARAPGSTTTAGTLAAVRLRPAVPLPAPLLELSRGCGCAGAGFYVNATEEPWSANFHMYDYITKELPGVVGENFAVDTSNASITGHSMGGHGALTIALKNPGVYKSCSAFAPICNPLKCPWGEKAFTGYLGSVEAGAANDATELVKSYDGPDLHILIDQGTADNFYKAGAEGCQLLPENFAKACGEKGVELKLNMREGYDHSYYFIASFIDDHIKHHASFLKA